MPKRLRKTGSRKDPSIAAFNVVQRVIEVTEEAPKVVPIRRRKNPAAVALGRKGGLKSAAGRMEKIDEAERRRIASHAARERWARVRGDS